MGLPSIALKRPVLTAVLFIGVIVIGFISLMRLKVELYQGQNQGIVSIVVRARGGLPSQDVEKMITKPIEEAVGTVSRMKSLYSSSREAESRVTMEFEPGTDMKFAALEVREKFARVKPLLPREIEKPVIANYDDAQSAVLVFAVTSESKTPEEIREMVDVKLKPVLSRIDGVASVEVYGGRERKILVELDRDKMVAYNISIERVMDVLGQSNINLLAGNVKSGRYDFAVRTMGAFMTVEEVGDIGVKATRQGSIISLREIGTIKDSYTEANDYARLNLDQNVTVYVKKASVANTLEVARDLNALLDYFEEEQKQDIKIVVVSDKADAIARAIGDVRTSLLIGLVLTMFVIYMFLRKVVLSLIILAVIPCSLVATFIFMAACNISINIMTLSGLSLATGILVDTAIVILENIFAHKEKGMKNLEAVHTGSEEIWLPLLASMTTTLVVFIPIVLSDKTIQLTYGGFAFTISVSLVCSFVSALMLIPILIRQFGLRDLQPENDNSSERFLRKLKEKYGEKIPKILAKRWMVIGSVSLICLFTGWMLSKTPIDWPSTFEENEFAIITFPLAGAQLDTNDEVMRRIEEILSKIPDVTLFSTTVSKDDLRLFVRLKPSRQRQYSKDEIMKLIDEEGNAAIKEIHNDFSLIVDEGGGSSESKKLIVNIYGQDGDELEKLAKEFANQMSKIDGLSNIVMTDLRKRPEYSLVVDKGKAAMYGLSVKSVADSMHAQVRGMRPTKFHEYSKGEEIETITRLQAIYRQKLEDLGQIFLETKENRPVAVSEIANFYPSVGPQTIDRKEKHRYVFVKGDVKRPIELVAADAKALIKNIKLPDDYYWRFGGGFDELMESKTELGFAVVLTVFLIYMVMACLYQSYVYPLLIMGTVPMSAIGVWLALSWPMIISKPWTWLGLPTEWIGWLPAPKPLSTQVFIGIILLAGYVVNAGIILVDTLLRLDETKPMEERLIITCKERLRPILMTVVSTVIGFSPMAFSFGQASDLWAPLAMTIIGGLISSTILTLFVLPCMILSMEDLKKFLKGELEWKIPRWFRFSFPKKAIEKHL